MADKDLQGSSELYVKHSTQVLFVIGLAALVLFLVLVFYFVPDVQDFFRGTNQPVGVASAVPELRPSTNPYDVTQPDKIEYTVGEMGLRASPSFVYKYMVPLNTTSEETVVLTAEYGTIRLGGMRWSQADAPDNFQVESVASAENQMPACALDLVLRPGESCQFKVVWTPKNKAILSNDLLIAWSEDAPMASSQTFVLRVSESSWDSQDCVCCSDAKEPKLVEDTEFNVWRASDGKVKDIIAPDKVAIALDGRVLGTIQGTEVVNPSKKTVGRILPDLTVVDENLKVLGAAVNILPVMNAKGEVIGEVKPDNSEFVRAVNAQDQLIGYVLPDGSVVSGQQLVGVVMPWGLVINYAEPAALIGVTMKDGSVIDLVSKKPIGRVLPSGFVVSQRGSIIGGVVPKGVPMADGCQSLGQLLPTGEIINEYQQQTGFVTPYGLVMDMNAIPQGRVVRQGLIFNENGPVGEINPQGRVSLPNGTMACVTSDGLIKNGDRVTGGVLAQGRVVGYDLQVQGITFPDGGAYSARGVRMGTVQPSGRVVNNENRMIGSVIPKTTAITPACQLLGLIDINGQVLNEQAQMVGNINPEGQIVGADKSVIGKATPMGALVDLGKEGKGIVGTDGYVHTSTGQVIGCVSGFKAGKVVGPVVSTEGQVLGYYDGNEWAKTLQGEILGRVLADKTVLAADTGKVIGAVIVAGHPVIDLDGKVI
ncbi:MAG: hypothetical protein ILP11_02465, partial [Alphaproteobacteria bacterium]|nr:hypothetical protein [Alphaproteobacteria bacterium]